MYCPNYYKIVSGTGVDQFEIVAFDKALIDAGIANYNLVKVSSILPAHCEHKETIDLPEGSILYTAYAAISNKKGYASAAVSISFPINPHKCGVIFESSDNCSEIELQKVVSQMGINALKARNEKLRTQIIESTSAYSDNNITSVAFAAVVMW